MLETIGAAGFEWIIGETLDNARLKLGREPYAPAVQEPRSAALMERLTTRLDPMPEALQDPAACVRCRLAPVNEPTIGGRSYWQRRGLDGDSVVDAVTAKVLRGMTDNARRGGSFELGPSGRSITGQRLVVCAGTSP